MVSLTFAVAVLSLTLSTSATNIQVYASSACSGSYDVCSNVAAGACCSGSGSKHSVKAVSPAHSVQAYASSGCSNILGGSGECFGSSQAIKGAHWITSSDDDNLDVDKGDAAANPECFQATHRGMTIEGKRYLLEMRGPIFDEYEGLITEDEKARFLMKRADVVEDDE